MDNQTKKETANYVVITPAGPIYVQTASEAKEYKDLYGFPYKKNPDKK